jgi:molecular chaperone GrpE
MPPRARSFSLLKISRHVRILYGNRSYTARSERRADSGAAAPDAAAELAAAKALAEERYAELQYARAEIDNVRKRATRIADERLTSSRKQLIGKFLPVLDNLQRALAFGDSQDLRGGLQATLKGFEALLASEGLVAVQTVGKPFDPHVAEAVSTQDTDEFDDDVVVSELQAGYRIGDELLRPAMVVVARRRESAEATPQTE